MLDVKGIPKSSICSCCDMVMDTVKKGKPDLKNKVMLVVVVRQRKSLCRNDGVFIYFKGIYGKSKGVETEVKGIEILGFLKCLLMALREDTAISLYGGFWYRIFRKGQKRSQNR
ncbi:60S ribosomal protein L23 [Tanacetum coccineum]